MRPLTDIHRLIMRFPPEWRRICASARPELAAATVAVLGISAEESRACGCRGCLHAPAVYRDHGVPFRERVTPEEYDAWRAAQP